MVSGQDIPYQLRPNKFIDRQIFVDLLAQVCAERGARSYVYVSMGGKHLVDQESVYRRVGIDKLFSFDGAEWVVKRQEKNAPHGSVICEAMHSSSLPGHIDSLSAVFDEASNFIFWLDYTKPSERLSQLQEFSQLLQKCQPGDLVRVTLNAEPRTLGSAWEKKKFAGPGEYRADRLKLSLGDYYPAQVASVREDEVPHVISQAVALAASEAQAVTGLVYRPILLTTYADGQRMFTAAALTVESEEQELPQGLQTWGFLPSGWLDIVDISAPDLSMREKILIDRLLTRSPREIMDEVGFSLAEEQDEAERAIESYKRLHRYYPSFYAIGIQ